MAGPATTPEAWSGDDSAGQSPAPLGAQPAGRKPRRHALRVVAVVIVCAIVVSSGVVLYLELTRNGSGPGYPPPPSGWTTFLGAWNQVASAFAPFSNGSWSVHFAEGAAADGRWSPPATLWLLYGPYWLTCEEQLSGISTLTFWNASEYPTTSSSNVFTSGAAPLWTFVFNGSGPLTFVASWFQGSLILNAALNASSPCLQYSIFNAHRYNWVDPAHELDSNAIANEVYEEDQFLGQNPVPVEGPLAMPAPPQPAVALYFPGREVLPGTIVGGALWSVAYTTCGLPGSYGTTYRWSAYLLNSTSIPPGHSYSWLDGTIPCSDAWYFDLFNRTTVSGAPSGPGEYAEWRTNLSFMTSAVPAEWTASGLTTSQFGLQLNSSAAPFQSLPTAGALCGPGARNLTSCAAPSEGWYGVLLSPNGSWLDSYPSVANGSDWSVPGVQVQSGDLVAFVGSGGYASNDTFGFVSGDEPFVEGGDYLLGS